MKLYLIRHGIALEPHHDLPDEQRPLTSQGQTKTQKVAQRLQQLGLHFDQILTSPLVRAQQTAQILLEQGLSDRLETCAALAPGGNIQDFCQTPRTPEAVLALVGHQPDLGYWAELFLWGQGDHKFLLKKAGIIGIQLPATERMNLGQGQCFLLTSPKWLL